MLAKRYKSGQRFSEMANHPNQNLSSLSQLRDNSLHHFPFENRVGSLSDWRKDPTIVPLRNMVRKRIFEKFPRETNNGWTRHAHRLAIFFENQLYIEAASAEEYANRETMQQRLQIILHRTLNNANPNQQVSNHVSSPSLLSSGLAQGYCDFVAHSSPLSYFKNPRNENNLGLSNVTNQYGSEKVLSHEEISPIKKYSNWDGFTGTKDFDSRPFSSQNNLQCSSEEARHLEQGEWNLPKSGSYVESSQSVHSVVFPSSLEELAMFPSQIRHVSERIPEVSNAFPSVVFGTGVLSDFNHRDSCWPIGYNFEDMHSQKRLKTENPFSSLADDTGISSVVAPFMHRSFGPEVLPSLQQCTESPIPVNYSEVMDVNKEPLTKLTCDSNDLVDNCSTFNSDGISCPSGSEQLTHVPKHEKNELGETRSLSDTTMDKSKRLSFNTVSVPSEDYSDGYMEEVSQVRTAFEQAKPEVENDSVASQSDREKGLKVENVKMKGVSLIESFTLEQIKTHILSLRNWTDQSTSKDEMGNKTADTVGENICQLCGVIKLSFSPLPMYCSSCNARIKRGVIYYCTSDEFGTQHCFCTSCYQESRGGGITFYGTTISKAKLTKRRNNEETEESWVQCDKCGGWQHQICALYNDQRDMEGKAEYICPKCFLKELETQEHIPLPVRAVLDAKDLPRTMLSDHIEERLFRNLKEERENRAKDRGLNVEEVSGADDLVVRVVSSVDKKLEVKKQFLDIIPDENYPTEFPYRSKVILLFQKIDGVDVCLFSMYAQEFGSECSHPNQRCIYISYIDSVKYFRPDIKNVKGEALRTFVYHEILIGYLEYCKKRFFTKCYLWACPPIKGEDYILNCHPENQKLPKSDKLRNWYHSMLKKAAEEGIVVHSTNLYEHFFVPTIESNTKITTARLPYFDGAYWSGAAEDLMRKIEQENRGGSSGKMKKQVTKRTLQAMGHTENPSGSTFKDIFVMQKLGHTILPVKEDFIVVHMEFVCNHCDEVILSECRWSCSQCKYYHICHRCHDSKKNVNEKDSHTLNGKEKHMLSQVMVDKLPSDTREKDVILDNCLMENRHTFLDFCQKNHYQFDTPRRAKHSSMMILHHLGNTTLIYAGIACSICHEDTVGDESWLCKICPGFDVCVACYRDIGDSCHIHALVQRSSKANLLSTSKGSRQKKSLTSVLLNVIQHASKCHATRSHPCSYPNCINIKKLFYHASKCTVRVSGGCQLCKKAWLGLSMHSRNCRASDCGIPRCMDLKKHAKWLAEQSENRRRAAVTELLL